MPDIDHAAEAARDRRMTTVNTYAQPHQGITGTARDGDPILTLDGSLAALEMFGLLRRAVLVGNPAPVVRDMFERMTHPRPGDAVVVWDSIYRRDVETKLHGIGYLVETRVEWGSTDSQWAAYRAEDSYLTDEDRMTDTAWYVQYGPDPADVCRWTNCAILAIPRDGVICDGTGEPDHA